MNNFICKKLSFGTFALVLAFAAPINAEAGNRFVSSSGDAVNVKALNLRLVHLANNQKACKQAAPVECAGSIDDDDDDVVIIDDDDDDVVIIDEDSCPTCGQNPRDTFELPILPESFVSVDSDSTDLAAACVQDESFCKDANLKRVANRNSVIDEIFFYTEL